MKRSGSPLDLVSRETREKLDIYASLLLRWNARINLVGRQTEGELWQRHFADSLQLASYMPVAPLAAVDLGSGGGFPGLVLAIATGHHFHLVEADVRKAAFLREVAEATNAPAAVHAIRLEDAILPPAGLVTCRALAPLPRLLPAIARFLAPDGVALLLKGENVDEELTGASAEWHMKIERHKSVTDPRGVILRLTEVHPV